MLQVGIGLIVLAIVCAGAVGVARLYSRNNPDHPDYQYQWAAYARRTLILAIVLALLGCVFLGISRLT
jgi:hypothetical protein